MSDWLYDLPVGWMALVIFTSTYCVAAAVFAVVTKLAVDDRARAFKSVSPGMLPPLGIIFGLLVGFMRCPSRGRLRGVPRLRSRAKPARCGAWSCLRRSSRAKRKRNCAPSSIDTSRKPFATNGRQWQTSTRPYRSRRAR